MQSEYLWVLTALLSAVLLGFYDVFKKKALACNAVMPVLFLNTLLCSLLFIPFIIVSENTSWLDSTLFYVPGCSWKSHQYIVIKSFIVLTSWLFGYFAIKHLPITIVGPINATRPVMVLLGAMLVFGESLNLYQWIGVVLAVVSFALLSRSGKKEGIDFKHNRWIFFLLLAAMTGAASGLYDKYLMASVNDGGLGLNRMSVQSWYNIYQSVAMGVLLMFLWWPKRQSTTPFHWTWNIVFISLFLSIADFLYFYSLSLPGAMVSIVSMVRRGSVIVSFLFGFIVFGERNIKSKAMDLVLVLIGMLFLCLGSMA